MKEILFTLILGISLIMATKQDKNFIVRPVYSVDSVRVVNVGKTEILLNTISTVPNPCYKFSHFESEQSENKILITVFAKIEKNVNCISIIGKMESEIKIPVSKPGSYRLIFVGKTKNHEMSVDIKP